MYDVDFNEIAKIPFSGVLDYLGIPYQEINGILHGRINDTPFTVNPKKNLYWITEEDRGNVITFTAKVRGCNNYTAAKELRDHLMPKIQASGNTASLGTFNERQKSEEDAPAVVQKSITRELTLINEKGEVEGKLVLQIHA